MSQSSEKARKYSRNHAERFRHELSNSSEFPASAETRRCERCQTCRRVACGPPSRVRCQERQSDAYPRPSRRIRRMARKLEKTNPRLMYGHYDVVPAEMEDGWNSPPFEPSKRRKDYARGATDDKGQLFIHIKALKSDLEASTAGRQST